MKGKSPVLIFTLHGQQPLHHFSISYCCLQTYTSYMLSTNIYKLYVVYKHMQVICCLQTYTNDMLSTNIYKLYEITVERVRLNCNLLYSVLNTCCKCLFIE